MTPTATSTLPPPPSHAGGLAAPPPPPTWAPRHTYRPLGALAGWMEGIAASGVVVSLTLAAAAYRGIEVQGDLILVPSAVQALVLAEAAVMVALRVVAHVWSYRATANAEALGASGLDYTPASSVWWYYVPIASLFKPAGAMQQVARASEPGFGSGTAGWRGRPADPLVTAWWAAYLVAMIGGQIALAAGVGSTGERAAWTVIGLALALASGLWWGVVRRITTRQRHRAVRLARAGELPAIYCDHAQT